MQKMTKSCFERMVSEQKELAERLSKLNRFLEKNWMSVRSDPDGDFRDDSDQYRPDHEA